MTWWTYFSWCLSVFSRSFPHVYSGVEQTQVMVDTWLSCFCNLTLTSSPCAIYLTYGIFIWLGIWKWKCRSASACRRKGRFPHLSIGSDQDSVLLDEYEIWSPKYMLLRRRGGGVQLWGWWWVCSVCQVWLAKFGPLSLSLVIFKYRDLSQDLYSY